MIKGLDLLAGAKYSKEVVYAAKQGYSIGLFAETFGDAYKTAEKAIRAGCKLLRLQLLWEDNHVFGDKHIPKIKKLAAKYNKLANKYPHVDIRLSVFCEHNLNNPDKYLDICQQAAPSCLIINTPWKGAFSKKYINEIHGNHTKPSGRYQYSFDGTECTNADIESYKRKYGDAEVFFMWSNRFNLKYSEKDRPSRPQRIKESRQRKPSKDYVDSIAYLFTDKGNTSLEKKMLIKSHAERHGANDPKGDKLLVISRTKANALILKQGNKQIGKLNYYGSFDSGGYRYYANTFGYKFGCCDVYAGNKKIATINGGFRDGGYR